MIKNRSDSDHLKNLIEEAIRKNKEGFDHSSKGVNELLENINIYQQELEYQNDELTRINEILEKTKANYFDLFFNAPIGYVVYRSDTKMVEANSQFLKKFDLTTDSVKGMKITDLIHPEDQDLFYFKTRELVEMGKIGDYELRFLWGIDEITVSIGSVLDNVFGENHIRSTIHDISQSKRDSQILQQAKDSAEEMARVKTYFLANMSHEIRTPLVAILGYSEILSEELQEESELKLFAERITSSGNRLLDTLNLVLNLAKLEKGVDDFSYIDQDIVPVLREVCQLFSSIAKKKGLKLDFINTEHRVICKVDRTSLVNVINNLLSNAIKFTSEGSITVTCTVEDRLATIIVEDTGIGIAEERQKLIWEEFRQVSEGYGRGYEGTGLGLSLVKKYTSLMGGDVTLTSKKGEGSSFIVTFPVTEFQGQALADSIDPETNEVIFDAGVREKVLYVEDDQVSADIVKRGLAAYFDVDIATNSQEAYKLIEKGTYSGILLDIHLKSDKNGIQLAKEFRRMPQYRNTPFVAITAYGYEDPEKELLPLGFDRYLLKPFRKSDLIELLVPLIKKR